MLRRLHVKNFALVDDLELEFSQGFNALSGETGAGKSIIVGAISLILGERASTSQVREGADEALIEAVFQIDDLPSRADLEGLLEDNGLPLPAEEELLIITREISGKGKSSMGRVNGRSMPVSFLRELGKQLVDLLGQHQHQSLLQAEKHLQLLDDFGGSSLHSLRAEIAGYLQEKKEYLRQLEDIGQDSQERERRLDILNFQIEEIDDASLVSGEEDQLLERQKILANAEKILDSVAQVYENLSGGTGNEMALDNKDFSLPLRDRLGRAVQELNEVASHDAALKPILEMLESASAYLEEASTELRHYQESFNFNPRELEEVQERLELIRKLKRKYGATVEEVIEFAEQCRRDYERLQRSEEEAKDLEEKIQELDKMVNLQAMRLSELRRETALHLEKHLQEVFPELALEDAVLHIKIEPGEITSLGADRVEFLFSANPGESPRPLINIISGGERSRVMLALKTVFIRYDRVPTLIFDEVDTGIGGAAVLAVAEKLAALSLYHQVIVVTHSPQVASMADMHYLLYKEVKNERTVTIARKLDPNERKEELARMLDGGTDPVNIEHVNALLERAQKYKSETSQEDG